MNFDDDFDTDDRFFWRFHRAKTKVAKGGIKAHTKKFGNQWWAAKWLEAIETFGPSKRVARGRSYARKGQVLDLRFEPGHISAAVQGSRDTPYQVEIFLGRLNEEKEAELIRDLQTEPIFAATLLTGELHPDVERLFRKFDFPLFPTKEEGRQSTCSCPDTGNPCKHIAAVYYLISLELERDPFLLLYLRGIPREKLVSRQKNLFAAAQLREALPVDPQQFWRAPRVKEITIAPAQNAKTARPAVLQRLGSFPFWRGEQNFLETLERIYRAASEKTTDQSPLPPMQAEAGAHNS
jgi:uncharacterized Zn finger protein